MTQPLVQERTALWLRVVAGIVLIPFALFILFCLMIVPQSWLWPKMDAVNKTLFFLGAIGGLIGITGALFLIFSRKKSTLSVLKLIVLPFLLYFVLALLDFGYLYFKTNEAGLFSMAPEDYLQKQIRSAAEEMVQDLPGPEEEQTIMPVPNIVKAVESERRIVKFDGVTTENNQLMVFIFQDGKMSSLKAGDDICGGEVIQIFSPREPDGITSPQNVDQYEYRIKVRFGEEDKIFKNGGVICEETDAESSNRIKGGDEELRTEPSINNSNAPVSAKLNQSEDGFYKKRSQEVIAQYEGALNFDNNLRFADALEGYRKLLPKAKTAYSTTDMADKKKLHEIIEGSERREKEISRYMETVRDIRGRFNSAGSLSKWLKKNIHYKSDRIAGDYWQPPDETLKVKTGDCEDFAILVQALLAEVGTSSEIVFIGLKKGIKNSTHAICVFEQGGLYGYFSGPYLHQPFALSIQQLVDEKYLHWTAIAEIKFPAREKIFLARR